jgi:tRNA A37 threonylcarbamoyladenosine dehydratase
VSLSPAYLDRFSGVGRLYGVAALERIARARVAVVGLGGVGSWAVESLARSGINHFYLIDGDDVCVTNTNRQVHSLAGTVGLSKVSVLSARVQAINPECSIEVKERFLSKANHEDLFAFQPDAVIDAIDSVEVKKLLLVQCRERKIPLIMAGAAGGRRDPTRVRIADLSHTTHDGLLRQVRKQLRKHDLYPPEGVASGITAVYAEEHPVFPGANGEPCAVTDSRESLRLDCTTGFGTSCPVTAAFGLACASATLKLLY